MNSRSYQNLLHLFGATSSLLMIYGAVIVGGGNSVGILIMTTGAFFQRITHEIEFKKMGKLIEEKNI